MQDESLKLTDTAFRADEDACRSEEIGEEIGEHLAATGDAQGGKLQDQPVVVPVDGETREAVAFAGDQSTSSAGLP